MYFEELHNCYKASLIKYLNLFEQYGISDENEINKYFRACALSLWSADSINCETATNAINELYLRDKQFYKEGDIEKALIKMNSKARILKNPSFYDALIRFDLNHDTIYSRIFVESAKVVMLSLSMADGTVDEKNIDYIKKQVSRLYKRCDELHVPSYQTEINLDSFLNSKSSEDDEWSVKSNHITELKKEEESVKQEDDNLNDLIGLERVKNEVKSLTNFINVQKLREENNLPTPTLSYHLVFTGNPGTGKTTVARIIAKTYKDLGIVSKGQLVEVDRSDLVAGYVGQTAIKTQEVINKALGGVLFIDEAYSLEKNDSGQGYGQEAIDTILKAMEDHRNDLVVIVAGYDEPMKDFINSNPGLQSRFNRYIHFDDYSADELYKIFISLCDKNKYVLSKNAIASLKDYFVEIEKNKHSNFANAREVRNMFEDAISKQATRISKMDNIDSNDLQTILLEDLNIEVKQENKLEDYLFELDMLIGLDNVKKEVRTLAKFVENQKQREKFGMPTVKTSMHLVFMGNPGTGKTTVARIIAKIYKELGVISNGQMVEVDRGGLVAGYVGQTAIKTQEVINRSIGGVLFIDEAYTLANGGYNDFGQEAIDTLLKAMEDYRDDLVVIVAGYDELMKKFIRSNPGLESRFNTYIHFDDYNEKELMDILRSYCARYGYKLTADAAATLNGYFKNIDKKEFGNGRGVRNIAEKIIKEQAIRLSSIDNPTENDCMTLNSDDIKKVVSNERC